MPPTAIAEVRSRIRSLQKARESGTWNEADQARYVDLCAKECAILADLRSHDMPIPMS